MSYVYIESTEDFEVGNYRVRVWINETEVSYGYSNAEFRLLAEKAKFESLPQFVKILAEYPNVNALQVINIYTGSGVVVYLNW